MFHVSRTLKNGATADLRKVVDVAAANGTPVSTLVNRTEPMVPRGVWQNIDAIVYAASDKFDVAFWWWYESAQLWVLDLSIGTAGYTTYDASKGTLRIPILDNNKSICADGLYVEVANIVGHPQAQIWLQGQQ